MPFFNMGTAEKPQVAHLLLGGPELLIVVAGRDVLFEDHPRVGPWPLDKRTRNPVDGNPPAAFWDAIKRWMIDGKKVDGDRCVVPDWCPACRGSGSVDVERLSNRSALAKRCSECEGKKVRL